MDRKNYYMSLKHLLVVLLIFFTVNILFSLLYPLFSEDIDVYMFSKLSYIPTFLTVIILTYIYGRHVKKRTGQTDVFHSKAHFNAIYVLMGVLYMFVFSILLEPLEYYLDIDMNNYLNMFNQGSLAFNILITVISAPILEEIFFRGLVLRNLLNRYKEHWAIIFSALFFSIAHMSLVQSVPAFFMGLLFGYIYVRTNRSLSTVIWVHLINNLLSYAMIVYDVADDPLFFYNFFSSKIYYVITYGIAFMLTVLLILLIFKDRKVISNEKIQLEDEDK